MTRCVSTKGERRCMLVAHGEGTPHWSSGEYWGGRCARCGRPAEEAHEACKQVAPEGEPVAEAWLDPKALARVATSEGVRFYSLRDEEVMRARVENLLENVLRSRPAPASAVADRSRLEEVEQARAEGYERGKADALRVDPNVAVGTKPDGMPLQAIPGSDEYYEALGAEVERTPLGRGR